MPDNSFDVVSKIDLNEVANAIQRLTDCESRVMLALKRGESIREIAQALHLSDNQVHQIRLQAIQQLRRILGVASRENS